MNFPKQELVPIEQLHGAEYNPRIMPDTMMRSLMNSLKEFGFVQPIVARREDGLVLGGHQRLEAYRRLLVEDGKDLAGQTAPVVYLDGVDDNKAKVLNLALNKISGEWDYDKLFQVMVDLKGITDVAVDLTGFEKMEIDDILGLVGQNLSSATETTEEMDVDEALARNQRRFVFEVADEGQAERCREVLRTFGMTGPGNAAVAFVAAMEKARG